MGANIKESKDTRENENTEFKSAQRYSGVPETEI
jgi:hypothetical protein